MKRGSRTSSFSRPSAGGGLYCQSHSMFDLGSFLSLLICGVAGVSVARKKSVAVQKKMAWWWEREKLCFPLFLRGVLEKVVCRTWFFCGENVVRCVVNVVKKLSFFGDQKWDTSFEYFFNILSSSGFVLTFPRAYLEQATANTGILHCVQDDDGKRMATESCGLDGVHSLAAVDGFGEGLVD